MLESKVWSGKVESFEDITNFFTHLIFECHLNFHPDDNLVWWGSEIITPIGTITLKQMGEYDKIMIQCFMFCESKDNINVIYELGMRVLERWIKENTEQQTVTVLPY